MIEQPLTGGRMTPGVVRVGDTVRRPASSFTAVLLELLADKDFTPNYLGRDEKGRDILTYLEGDVPSRYQRWEDQQIAAAAVILRAFHDATRNTHLAGDHKVVCHHDPAPTNFVFNDGVPTAIFDFDLAAPGDPLEDLGYAAWTWCIASKHADPLRQAHQVAVLANAYGLEDTTPLTDAILQSQLNNAQFWADRPCEAAPERIAWSHREHAFVTTNRHTFEAALRAARPS
ncbi:phosphotransferase [Kribbella sp. NPDC004536]|uniref:phosphotransferase n=1 Tax=Kribbella sp. NPDC004536 TaxID=3364106 RepID=UPI00369CDA9C